jgi:uncharacterized protein (TIGR02246 family)
MRDPSITIHLRSTIVTNAVEDVTAVVNAFAECWNRHDIAGFSVLFAPDAEFVNVVGIWWQGREAIRQAHAFTHSNMFKESQLTIRETQVRFPVAEIAIARSSWTLSGHLSPEGEPLPPRNGLLVNVLSRQAGTWSIIDSQNTDHIEGVLSRPQ